MKSSTAGAHRLFEFRVERPRHEPTNLAQVADMVNALKDNHGAAGELYAAYLGRNQAALSAQVQSAYDALMKKYSVPAEERYWVATIAVLVVGAGLANQLGLTAIDERGLLGFLREQWKLMKTSSATSESDLRNASNLASVLARFLRDMRSHHTIYTDRIWASKGRPKNGDIAVIRSPDELWQVKVQIGKGDRRMRVATADLSNWFKREKIPTQAFFHGFAERFKMKSVMAGLASGTEFATGQMQCRDFDLNDPEMISFFEGIELI